MTVFNHPEFAQHERIVFHEDPASGLKAIIAIHNRNLGPAIGGCRMLPYAGDEAALTDVLRLSRGMTYKNAMAGIPYGGGKSVIIGDPSSEKTTALLHAMGDLVETLGGDYITSFDSGTTLDNIRTIGERTRHVGGIVKGAGNASASTAYGVLVAIKAALRHRRGTDQLEGVKIMIQGLGNVGLRLAQLLKDSGAEIFATDTNSVLLANTVEEQGVTPLAPGEIFEIPVDVFSPNALGAVINEETINQLKFGIIAGGANNQLANPEMGELLRKKDILYAPDYVANGGGITELHYQFSGGSEEALKTHLDSIGETLAVIFETADFQGRPTSEVADQLAEERIRVRNSTR